MCLSVDCVIFVHFCIMFYCCGRNAGTEPKILIGCGFESVIELSQFELSCIHLDRIDLSVSSRKAQQILPLQLEPDKSASVSVFCTAR